MVVSELCLGVRLRLMIAAVLISLLFVASMSVVVSAEPSLKPEAKAQNYVKEEVQINQVMKVSSTPKNRSGYVHVWPVSSISTFSCCFFLNVSETVEQSGKKT